MSDGAHLGVGADRALGTVLGGEPPPAPEEGRNPDQMRDWLLSAPGEPFAEGMGGYGECARYAAKLILEAFFTIPSLAAGPMEDQYDKEALDRDGWTIENMKKYRTADGLYEVLKREMPETYQKLSDLGLSGFMWGWAVNAARYCIELPPEPNPAIIKIR